MRAADQRRKNTRRAGKHPHIHLVRNGGLHKDVSGIGQKRRARVADQRQRLAFGEKLHALDARFGVVVLVQLDDVFLDFVVMKKAPGLLLFFAHDDVAFLQGLQAAERDVIIVSDRRCHNVQRPHCFGRS